MIRQATIKDINKINKIVNLVLLKNLASKKQGFLMENPGKEFYRKIIKESKYCYVVFEDKKLVGFLLAYPNVFMKPNDDIHRYFIKNYAHEKFIYIYQIAIRPNYQNKKLGYRLYQFLFNQTENIKKMVVTSAKPANAASKNFHLKIGFKKVGKLFRDDGGANFIFESFNLKPLSIFC